MIQKRLRHYWITLSFQSGVINSAGFVLFSIYLTHLTGTFSRIGFEAEHLNFSALIWWLSIPTMFLVGSMASTVFIEGHARKHNNPRYEWVFGFFTLSMVMICFSQTLNLNMTFVVNLISLCAGAQNAVFNERTGAIMRTTHLTGTTTDLGTSLARIFFKTLGPEKNVLDFEKNLAKLRCFAIIYFIFGSVVGSLLAIKFGFYAFGLPAIIYLIIAYDSTKVLKILEAKHIKN